MTFATATLPGTGGIIRASPADFQVEEIPAYLPSGEGEHLYLWIEKEGLTTAQVVALLAARAGISPRDAGCAGLKDKRAVTRQWISLSRAREQDFEGFAERGVRVLRAARHANKLRTGHLRGNRFSIAIRGAGPEATLRAQAVLYALAGTGLPNAYGPQRFGREGETVAIGRALLGGSAHPQLGRARRDGFLRRLAVSAVQSDLFNRVLERRLCDGSWRRVLAGEVLQKPTGSCFASEDPALEQPRVDRFEIAPAGPMFGPRMLPAWAIARGIEQEALAAAAIDEAAFARGCDLAQGARRSLRVALESPSVEARGDAVWISFGLPRGSYASVVMAEVMKSGAEMALPDEEA